MGEIAGIMADVILKIPARTVLKFAKVSKDAFIKAGRKFQKVKVIITSRFDYVIQVQLPVCEGVNFLDIQVDMLLT
jgi:hypothetical protein